MFQPVLGCICKQRRDGVQLHGGILTFPRICCLHGHKQPTEKNSIIFRKKRVQSFSSSKAAVAKTCLEEMRAQQCGRGNKRGVNRPIWKSNSLAGAWKISTQDKENEVSPLVLLHDVALTDRPHPKCCWSHHGLQIHGQTWNAGALQEPLRTLEKIPTRLKLTMILLLIVKLTLYPLAQDRQHWSSDPLMYFQC